MEVNDCIEQIKNSARNDLKSWKPLMFNFSGKILGHEFKMHLAKLSFVAVHDELHGQLQELVKLRKPKQTTFTNSEVEALIQDHLNGTSEDDYGLWIYYPWSARIVHVLPEDEFIEVRTNRNRNKITLEESRTLSQKRVGIIGLSVGQSVSVTMAMERSFGEIRLADFDKLELTNLNRIRTGLHNLGLEKVISVAREIMEIDPFLNVKVFPEGITEKNIANFLLHGGKLDALIDECDGLEIKVLCRVHAKNHGIPVLMEASDRGTIDVERFDLEPDRPLLHGYIDHLDVSKIKDLKTNEEKVPYLLPIAGMETLSEKMRASMLEIGQSLTTWPQLSSAVTLGGGITADTYRRIMLNEFTQSGRYFVDLDELLPGRKTNEVAEIPEKYRLNPLNEKEMMDLLKGVHLNGVERAEMPVDLAIRLTKSAILAPSAGNNQPWKWVHNNNALYLFHDRARSVSFSDFGDMGSMIAFGACLENISLTAKQLGFDITIDYFPLAIDQRLICRICLTKSEEKPNIDMQKLYPFIGYRHTNRTKTSLKGIGKEDILQLQQSIQTGSIAALKVCTDRDEILKLASIVSACERIRIMHPLGHHDFYRQEVRWTKEESAEKADGIDIATIELNASEMAGMKLAADPSVMHYLRKWNGGRGFEKLSKEAVANSPALGLVQIKGRGKKELMEGGRALQRIWLKATELSISIHPVSAGLFMFARLIEGNGEELSPNHMNELSYLNEEFQEIFPGNEGWKDVFLFRMFKSDTDVVRSHRLPLDKVFISV
ncbi:MAG: Rv1355c family protein [Vicingaceae bacterium]